MKVKFALDSWALYFPSWSQSRNSVLAWVDIPDHHQLWHTCGPCCTVSSFLLLSKRGDYWCLSTFCHSQWLLALCLCLGNSHLVQIAFVVLKESSLSFAIWFHVCGSDGRLSSSFLHQQLSKHVLFSVSWGVCIFTGSGGRVFFFSLWKKGWTFLFGQKLLSFFMVKLRPLWLQDLLFRLMNTELWVFHSVSYWFSTNWTLI